MRERGGGTAGWIWEWGEGVRRWQGWIDWGVGMRERKGGRAGWIGEWSEGEKKGQSWMDGEVG